MCKEVTGIQVNQLFQLLAPKQKTVPFLSTPAAFHHYFSNHLTTLHGVSLHLWTPT